MVRPPIHPCRLIRRNSIRQIVAARCPDNGQRTPAMRRAGWQAADNEIRMSSASARSRPSAALDNSGKQPPSDCRTPKLPEGQFTELGRRAVVSRVVEGRFAFHSRPTLNRSNVIIPSPNRMFVFASGSSIPARSHINQVERWVSWDGSWICSGRQPRCKRQPQCQPDAFRMRLQVQEWNRE